MTIPPLPDEAAASSFAQKGPKVFDHYPDKPSLPAAFTIPVGWLGFSKPGAFYLLRRRSLVSLGFLDENRLLFTFQAGGLLQRDAGEDAAEKERHIQALVITLPEGRVEPKAQWTLADQARYLWMLKDGHFLLRDAGGLELGDATLKTTPYLRLPGRLLWLEMDPAQKVIIINSLEPAEGPSKLADPASAAGSQNTPTADARSADQPKPGTQPMLAVRTLERDSGKVIRTSEAPWTNQSADWPINSEGYLETLKESGGQWLFSLKRFAGGNKGVGYVRSACPPDAAYISERELIAATCEPGGGGKMIAVSASGAHLWETQTGVNEMWPLLVMAADGSRLAQEVLLLQRPAKRYKRLVGAHDLMGQMVRVFNARTGKVELEAPLDPILDAGGNVAISPSGRRVAILNAGAIQVFELSAGARPLPLGDAGR